MSKVIAWLKKWWGLLVGGLIGFLVLLSKVKLSNVQKTVKDSGEAVNKASEEIGKAKTVINQSEKVISESEKTINNAKRVVADEEAKMAERKKKDRDLSKRLDKLSFFAIVILSSILFITSLSSAENNSTTLNYDDLMQKYLEAVDIAKQYQDLYREAEKSNETLLAQIKELTSQLERNTEQMKVQQDQIKSLMEVVSNLQKWIGELQNTIMKLLGKPVEISGGMTLRRDFDGRLTPEGFISASIKIF